MSIIPSKSSDLDMIDNVLDENNRLAELAPRSRAVSSASAMDVDVDEDVKPNIMPKSEGL